MILIQMTGLSGAGKSTIANKVSAILKENGYAVEILDGDIYRYTLCKDLGFSEKDRRENLRRLSILGLVLIKHSIVVILAAINPYEDMRNDLAQQHECVKTIWVNCDIETLKQRDTKGLYQKSLLPDGHPDKITNLSGINDIYEIPQNVDLILNTQIESVEESTHKLVNFILSQPKIINFLKNNLKVL